MGKRIIQQRRGKGTLTYRVRKKGFRFKIAYPTLGVEGKGKVIKLIDSAGHSAPLAKIMIGKEIFYNLACEKMFEGQEIEIGKGEIKIGNIVMLKDIPIGTRIYNIETRPGYGGKLIRTGGNSAAVVRKNDQVSILMPSKKEKKFNEKCRATIGVVAGAGRLEKPIMKAGKKFYMMKSKGKLWPRTSAVKMNAIDHPFGSGRGKRIKAKIPKLNAPPGKKVGTLRPKRTGRRKR